MSGVHPDAVEFQKFGPWIDRVRGPHDLPRLFRDHPIDFTGAPLVLKVPRDIARRNAHAGMDLYDHVVAVGPEQLTILSRRVAGSPRAGVHDAGHDDGADGYDVRVVPYHLLAAVHDVVSLLRGALTVRTVDGYQVVLRYNGSARESVTALVDELRLATGTPVPARGGRALLEAAQYFARPGAAPDLGAGDVALEAAYRELAREIPGLVPWVWHGRQRVAPRVRGPAGLAAKVGHLATPMTLHAGIVASDTLTLEVIGRHDWLVRGVTPVHSSSHLVVPLTAVDDVELVSHERYDGAVVAQLVTGSAVTELVVPEGSDAHALFSRAAETLGSYV